MDSEGEELVVEVPPPLSLLQSLRQGQLRHWAARQDHMVYIYSVAGTVLVTVVVAAAATAQR